MIYDFQNMFSQAQAITSTANATNVIDLVKTAQDIGVGESLFILFTVTTTFSAGGAATLQIALVTDDNSGLSSPVTLQDQVAVIPVASLIAGFELPMRIYPTAFQGPMEKFLGVVYTVATGPMTAGNMTAGIVKDIQRWKAYPSNYVAA